MFLYLDARLRKETAPLPTGAYPVGTRTFTTTAPAAYTSRFKCSVCAFSRRCIPSDLLNGRHRKHPKAALFYACEDLNSVWKEVTDA